MKNIILFSLLLIPFVACAQYPSTGNKQRLGWQTTGDGLIWRGVAGDTVNKPNNRNYPYFQLDTVNSVLYRYVQTRGQWQPVSENIDIDSLIYATRFWVNSNFFPLQGGLLTGTGGNGFINFPLQSSPPSTPATGFSLYAGSTGNNISWMQPDGFFRRLVSPVTGTPRQYQFMARSYTLADSADVASNITSIAANYIATSNGTNLVARNLFDNNTYAGVLNSKPWQFGQWTTAGRPAGTTGYTGYNTTTAFTEGYFTSQWENYITSTGASSGQVSYFTSAGKVAGSSNFTWNNTNRQLFINGSTVNGQTPFFMQSNDGAYVSQSLQINSRGAIVSILSDGIADNPGVAVTGATSGGFAKAVLGLDSGAPYLGFGGGGGTSRDLFFRRGGAGYATITGASPIDGYGQLRIIDIGASSNNAGITVAPTSSTSNAMLRLRATTAGAVRPVILLEDTNIGTDARLQLNQTTSPTTGVVNDFVLMNNAPGKDIIFANKETSTTTSKMVIKANGNLLLGTTTDVTGYLLNMVGTGAMSLPRGTVAQRPTIVASTTPFRYNTDSTALEYGESVGTWRQLATRAYARSLVASATWLKPQLEAGDVTINALSNADFRINNLDTTKLNNLLIRSNSTNLLLINPSVGSSGTLITGSGFHTNINGTLTGSNGGTGQIILGGTATANSSGANFMMALGYSSNTSGQYAIGLGYNADATADDALAIGRNAVADETGEISIGSSNYDKLNLNATASGGRIVANAYGAGNKEAAKLSKTQSNFVAGFATDGTVLDLERKRDTTIYVTDADYNFSAAITSANILKRYNRILIYSKLTSGATSDNQIFLHSASSDFLQCEIIIYSNDASADSDATSIDFTTNGAVDGTGGTVSSYGMSAGQRVNIRAVDDGGYKWIYN